MPERRSGLTLLNRQTRIVPTTTTYRIGSFIHLASPCPLAQNSLLLMRGQAARGMIVPWSFRPTKCSVFFPVSIPMVLITTAPVPHAADEVLTCRLFLKEK